MKYDWSRVARIGAIVLMATVVLALLVVVVSIAFVLAYHSFVPTGRGPIVSPW